MGDICHSLVWQDTVDLTQPMQRRIVAGGCECMEVCDDIVALDNRIQQFYQIQQCLTIENKLLMHVLYVFIFSTLPSPDQYSVLGTICRRTQSQVDPDDPRHSDKGTQCRRPH